MEKGVLEMIKDHKRIMRYVVNRIHSIKKTKKDIRKESFRIIKHNTNKIQNFLLDTSEEGLVVKFLNMLFHGQYVI